MEQWKKVCKTIYVWDYICNFDDYITAYPILSVMQQRIQEYHRHGVKGIFLNGSGYFYSCLQEHFSFILSNMLIDPDLDVNEQLRTYYQDALPHIGDFMAAANIALERRARTTKKEFPLYGGIKDAVKTYIYEPGFREYYAKFLALRDVEMTHRERVIYEKTRQNVSFTYMELVRLHGIGPGGFAEKVDEEWEVKPAYRWICGAHFDSPEEAFIKKEEAEERRRALTDKQRRIYELYYEEGYTQEEIAQLLNIGQNAVHYHLKSIGKRLQKDMEKFF